MRSFSDNQPIPLLIISSVLSHAYPHPPGCIIDGFAFSPHEIFPVFINTPSDAYDTELLCHLLIVPSILFPAATILRFVANPASLLIATTRVHLQNPSNGQ